MINALSLPFIGSHEFRKELTRLLDNVKETNEPIVITNQGKPSAILTSVDSYNQLHEMIDELQIAIRELADKEYISELITQKKKIKSGKGIAAKDLYKQLGI
ncbi:hypothetical protein A3A49_00680 [Candidatus Curtissbacteria bacterium RIFCSPLOWO2_01_FULL_38_11b]|uniref:Antitoxin n=1 Tax=Candidatus Curtissbacteria bacterium RIFCSPLOWO2_01_FULL_38_11b TaxID=1797725 RepID=A0A1F5H452_9BACT|nr:MAG: hypothetical protein A3A49_00680 [Candidatus Curtissbacteria bacterium RIFCSPLOWO2_01_FULL_38_11b]